mmetsp:Transcript_45653/g.67355  ORF Transcript_45653/g.67355 Transcript_45653/m.67355 type:complete len:102 (+) Transcript_45653:84-389(+)|eukprot:CAMPEP_0195518050 /NCGR_PEP_ID=MMETSP0794_2-20130614/12052_1 /TAXON_ID=515487 /ORGANISM="Stephanopyxis turris, Strain CCMP 815" /LENGTH=101 /DNA_ID=CAMNT_0040646953 /DNA_START=73 /DNA_END=378 /DNA_ORIENTATION=-
MCSDWGSCGKGCAAYSIVGALFTAWVGIMLQYQPFFIGGIDDVAAAKSSAFGAAGLFIVALFLSIGAIIFDKAKSKGEVDENSENYQLNSIPQQEYGSRYD